MSWTARQQAMLREMGLRLWLPPAAGGAPPPPAMAGTVAADGQAGVRATTVRDPAGDTGSGTQASRVADADATASASARAAARTGSAATQAEADTPAASPRVPAVAAAPEAEATAAPLQQSLAVGDERAQQIARLPWPALRESVAGCTACRLCETRTRTVFGNGHPRAQWLVVGEAPGEQEDRTGEPFVGPAGQLLDRMLAALQLTRAEDGDAPTHRRVFVANTLKCRPPRNRNPQPDELALCEPYLQRQIALLAPRMILAMGAFALKLLLRTEAPVGKLRGQVHRYQGVPLVATYHPSYLLRQPAEKAKSWADLCLAADHFSARDDGDAGPDAGIAADAR